MMKMKSIFKAFASFALVCALMPAFVSCSNDDDEEQLAVTNIIGSYFGSLGANVMGTECEMPGEYKVTIQKDQKERDEVEVVVPETSFMYPGSDKVNTIPSFTIKGVNVKTSGTSYKIYEDNYSVTLDGVNYSGNISGTITGKAAEIHYSVRPGQMPMDINFTFSGNYK